MHAPATLEYHPATPPPYPPTGGVRNMGRSREERVLRLSSRQTARLLVTAMTQIDQGIGNAAAAAGRLEAELANANQVETLASPRADRTFQLFAVLGSAYAELAEHLRGLGQ